MKRKAKTDPDAASISMAEGAVRLMRLNASFQSYEAQITAFRMAAIMADAVADIFHKTVTDLGAQKKKAKNRPK